MMVDAFKNWFHSTLLIDFLCFIQLYCVKTQFNQFKIIQRKLNILVEKSQIHVSLCGTVIMQDGHQKIKTVPE